jgi:hypothetical protein
MSVTEQASTPPEQAEGRPDGKDDGPVNIQVAHNENVVIIQFGGPVSWVGMPPDNARSLARFLFEHALMVEQQAAVAAVPQGNA